MYSNADTEQVALWLVNDYTFLKKAAPIAKTDSDGGAAESFIRHLLQVPGYLDADDRRTLSLVRGKVALANVDFAQVRDEVNSMEMV